ncbi:K+-transporting ATPase ATPase B chain [Loktanella fryxellensis]|uniref:K+-transporting ATPase ATPase B chain n=1 Tax=Loktanella fryxellensis TaxID=245187 RepID=A0A1H8JA24_9RHOB|nr:K+-transporting ATPase ATPase B chain [Loktanella fryxellensis]
MTPGALTIFSISNDVAKCFAILPAIFFNAVIIPLLVPLALRGVTYRPQAASRQLISNLGIYGAGGLIAPFVGINLIDMAVSSLGLA